MSIEASHWAIVVYNVTEHARKLHPNNQKKQNRLIHHLLGIRTSEELDELHNKVLSRTGQSLVTRFGNLFRGRVR